MQKYDYAVQQLNGDDPFITQEWLDKDVLDAIRWQAGLSPDEVMSQREAMISKLEEAGSKIIASGRNDSWFQGCDSTTRGVSKNVNGYLFQELLLASGYQDAECIEFFRSGAPMAGELDCSGIGTPVPGERSKSISELQVRPSVHMCPHL